MDDHAPNNLESVLEQWIITQNICRYLPVGDLITFSRTNSNVRALLHGFKDLPDPLFAPDQGKIRSSLRIGRHHTLFWQRLKISSPLLCSNKQHTKGKPPKPCKYCSKPICEACIVRASFGKKQENTFGNRCRYLCPNCWESGNQSKSHLFPLHPSAAPSQDVSKWSNGAAPSGDYCTCTLQNDCWLCLECKAEQNAKAVSEGLHTCHGVDCQSRVDEIDRERHRICLWCDKPLPRQVGGRTRHVWNAKIIEARALNAASRSADLEEYHRKRSRQLRMSRREMRGNDAVRGDLDADEPQYLRHLDAINYRSHGCLTPSGDDVYNSKRGYWRYNRRFLENIGRRCDKAIPATAVQEVTQAGALVYCRTNLEKWKTKYSDIPLMEGQDGGKALLANLDQWHHLKCRILHLLTIEGQDIDTARKIITTTYDFDAPMEDYHQWISRWGLRWQDLGPSGTEGFATEDRDFAPDYEVSDEQYAKELQETYDRQIAQDMQVDWATKSGTDSEDDEADTRKHKSKKGKEVFRNTLEPELTLQPIEGIGSSHRQNGKVKGLQMTETRTPESLLSQSLQKQNEEESSNVVSTEVVETHGGAVMESGAGERSEEGATSTQDRDESEQQDAGELITLPDGTIVFDGPEDAFPSMDPFGPNGGDDLLRFAIANSYQRHSIDDINRSRRSSQIAEEVRREIAVAAAASTEVVMHNEGAASSVAARRRGSSISAEEITDDDINIDPIDEDNGNEEEDDIRITVGAVAIEISNSDSDSGGDSSDSNAKVADSEPTSPKTNTIDMIKSGTSTAMPIPRPRPFINRTPTTPPINVNPTNVMPPSYNAVFVSSRARDRAQQ